MPAPRRIGLLTSTFLPNTGGVQVGLHNIAVRLQAKGYEPVVVTASHYIRELDELGWTLPYPVVGLPRKLWKWLPKWPRGVFWIMDRLLDRIARRHGIECWHVTLAYPSGICLVHYAQTHHAPHFIRAAGEDIQVVESVGYGVRLDPAVDALVREWLPRAQQVTAITSSVMAEYRALGIAEDRIKHIPNGVDLQRFAKPVDRAAVRARYGIGPDAVVFLAVGRNHAKKDFPTLVRAYARFRENHGGESALLVVGRNTPQLSGLVDELGLAGVQLLENIGMDDMKGAGIPQMPGQGLVDLYRAADAFVFPSKVETFGIVLVEAMAAGLPVIATDAPGCRDILKGGEFGEMLPVGDADAFAAAMQRVVADEAYRSDLVGRSKRRAADFSWDAVVDRYIDLYGQLANTGGKSAT